jgi:hypothetical protein
MLLGGAQNLLTGLAACQSRETLDSGANNFFSAHIGPSHLTSRKTFPWPGEFFRPQVYD